MLHIGAGYSNSCQVMLKLFGYDIFCNNLMHKNTSSKFGGIRGINHLRVMNTPKASVILHIGGRSSQ